MQKSHLLLLDEVLQTINLDADIGVYEIVKEVCKFIGILYR